MCDWILSHIPPWALIAIIAHGVVLLTVAYLILAERKIASWVQDRIGPNRVGLDFGLPFLPKWRLWGLGQPLADGLKFIFKEDYRPAGVDRVLFTLAPAIMMIVVIASIAVLPWGGIRQATRRIEIPPAANAIAYANSQLPSGESLAGTPVRVSPDSNEYDITYRYPFQIARLNIGVLYILAVLSLAVYGVVIGGWASNSKYSFLGGLRATANMISYEIPLGLSVLCIVIMFGTLDLATIVDRQCHTWQIAGIGVLPAWNVFSQPLAFLMFLICIHAEANRAPFDLAEAEQELVGGYHTEYSSMRFALFFLGEYAGMITTSALGVALFFGGWDLPFLRGPANDPTLSYSLGLCIIRAAVFFIKTLLIIFVFMWVRWSLPRFRFDQLMMLAWRALIPISLALVVMTAIVVNAFDGQSFRFVDGYMAIGFLMANFALAVLVLVVSLVIPAAPLTNRRVKVIGSRFDKTPLPAGTN